MLDNIRAHSLVVASIANLLASSLQTTSKQPLPNRRLCVSGALLHGIAKTPCLKSSCDHAAEGAKICRQHDYPEIAEIVAEHVMLPSYATERYKLGVFSAQDIVYYADKRVRHDSIVSLAERLEYILDKYGGSDAGTHERIRKNFSQCEQLEEYFFPALIFPLRSSLKRRKDMQPFFPPFPDCQIIAHLSFLFI
ncbi:MAG: HDIG domain-containing protein [Candidatus Electrothrix sp. AR3]|nr:HDIG domain-containing protein [Candidatus Electrothrix sp. AR3]